MGVVAAEANSPEDLWRHVLAARSPARWWEPGDGRPGMAVCAVDVPLERQGTRLRREHRKDRCTRMALLAAERAWLDAGLAGTQRDPVRAGVVVGTSRGPMATTLQTAQARYKSRGRQLPSVAAESTFACLHGSVSALLDLRGPCFTVTTACASGGHALALAADQLLLGRADVMLAGGADAPLLPALVDSFLAAGILDLRPAPDHPCRPFSTASKGTILGEGSAFLVLEKSTTARARGAKILAHLAGWAVAADGRNASPEGGGEKALAVATRQALQQSGAPLSAIGYVNAHGTGTARNDEIELQWFREFFGAGSGSGLYMGSTKPATGHCLGAGAILEAMICILALRDRVVPPSIHAHPPRAGFEEVIPWQGIRELSGRLAMSNSLGFWGTASSFLFAPPPV